MHTQPNPAADNASSRRVAPTTTTSHPRGELSDLQRPRVTLRPGSINLLKRFLALGVIMVSMASSDARAQPVGDCDDARLRDCCNGISYWMGYNPQTAELDGTNLVSSFEAYWAQNGYLDDSQRTRNVLAWVAFLAVFAMLVGLFWLTARHQWFAGWVQALLLIVIPGFVWYLVPDLLAKASAAEHSKAFVANTLRTFCAGPDAGDLDQPLTASCSATTWPAFFGTGEGVTALTSTATCERLASSDVDGILKDPENPCARDCALPMSASSPDGGPTMLRERWHRISNDLMGTCAAVAINWRAPTGPSPADWRSCASGLASRSVKRQITSNWVHGYAWAGFAIATGLSLFLFFFFRRK